ncbi:MAG: 3-dehydroquinate synthase [Arcticibacterium sp.]|jgi:3-dehydroquinate synthase
MKPIKTHQSSVHFSKEAYAYLNTHLALSNYSKIFILVDENTHEYCLPAFMSELSGDYSYEIIEIVSGEINKNLDSCLQVWKVLSELGADRKSLMINLGGGVITDMGGYIAASFKRGIDFIHVPTTLLSMVDASVGGKTGVDLDALKNQIGIIKEPVMVLVIPDFLKTLEERQIKSGFAEMLKHGIIEDPIYWQEISKTTEYSTLEKSIPRSIQIKARVVIQDPFENNIRKNLNYGHTLGHAIESCFLEKGAEKMLLHGEAIAAGMILEGYLSHRVTGLPLEQLEQITQVFKQHFKKINFSKEDIDTSLELLKFDKKNSHGEIRFVLLTKIGEPVSDILISEDILREAFKYYLEQV